MGETLSPLPDSDAIDNTALTVYIGRAAGRCQRKLESLKCALVKQIIEENQCRADSWPDENLPTGQLIY